jgi:hypothetical protein
MKTLFKISVMAIVLLCAILISCNKEENPVTDLSSSQQLKSGAVFTVSPSGNYDEDSYNIQTALNDAVAAGQGCTVKLTSGTFYLKDRIEIEGFDGYFKGAGKQNTIITTYDPVDLALPVDDIPALLKFRHGNVRMSDLTIQITNPEPATGLPDNEWWQNAFPNLIVITGDSYTSSTPGQVADASFNNVNFKGAAGNMFDGMFNVSTFIFVSSDGYTTTNYILEGTYHVTNCKFETAEKAIVGLINANNDWTIGNGASSGNTFGDINHGIQLIDLSNSNAEISHNKFNHMYRSAVFVAQAYFVDPANLSLSTFLIHANDIEAEDLADGIIIADESVAYGGSKLMDAVLSNNQIFLNNTEWGGIYGEGGDGIIVTNNKIWGNGFFGIYTGIWGLSSTNWFLQGNNVQQADTYYRPIYLGLNTSNFVVVGGSNQTNVRDRGTNNTLTGVNNMQGNDPGAEIQAALQLKHESIQSFRN